MLSNATKSLKIRGRLIDMSEPLVMGILNATPDSFYELSRVQTENEIAKRADDIIAQGGAIIDVGAFSTRPGAEEVTEEEEMGRLRKALGIVRRVQPSAILSVDTFRPDVARMAVEEYGADIINDVSEGGVTGVAGKPLATSDDIIPPMFNMIARLKVPYVLMSVRPDIGEIMPALADKVLMLHSLGVSDLLIDPGFGFGKTLEQNYSLLKNLDLFHTFGLPLLVGASRKSMIYKLLECSPDNALSGTIAFQTIALMKGVSVLRVHDVAEAVAAVRIVEAYKGNFPCPRNNKE